MNTEKERKRPREPVAGTHKLAMNIPTYSHGASHWLDVGLVQENLAGLLENKRRPARASAAHRTGE